ncbi:peptide deformylase [Endozoicomonas sp. Mp262]|uniref:peptide deformylase n=1 Tax=Endozoicomonas sp. Mp262 TaxID=2919499 RepID=UPI0021DB2228
MTDFSYGDGEDVEYHSLQTIYINETAYIGPLLRKKAEPVDPLAKETRDTANKLLVSAKTGTDAVGLAAPQIGISERVFVFQVPATPGQRSIPWTVVVNPEYTPTEDKKVLMPEGCFSVPHFYSKCVPRYPSINYRYYTLEGKRVEGKATGLFAQVFQHETDHLNGILYIDRLKDKNDPELHGLMLQSQVMEERRKLEALLREKLAKDKNQNNEKNIKNENVH